MLSFEITVHVRFVFHYFIYVHTRSLHVYLWFHRAGVRRQANDCTVRAIQTFSWDADIDLIDYLHYRMIYRSLNYSKSVQSLTIILNVRTNADVLYIVFIDLGNFSDIAINKYGISSNRSSCLHGADLAAHVH